jgi:hypothetical protein
VAKEPTIVVVSGLAYIEDVRNLPERFTAALVPEPGNRYNPQAVAVHAESGAKIGYLAPDVARHYYDALAERVSQGERVTSPATRVPPGERRVDATVLLDATALKPLHRD